MGFGAHSPDTHKPFNKSELLACAREAERYTGRVLPPDFDKRARLAAKNTLTYVTAIESPERSEVESVLYHKTRTLSKVYSNELQARPLLWVQIDTGGFNTLTTRQRLNEHLPQGWTFHNSNGIAYVWTPSGKFPHVDGAMYHRDGQPMNPELHNAELRKVEKLKRMIKAFGAEFDKLDTLPRPCAGDPWVADWNPRKVGESVLVDWLESKYVNGSFIVAAFRHKGMSDTGISMAFHGFDRADSHWHKDVKRAARDYFKAGLGLG